MGKLILVIDDNEGVRALFAAQLQQAGYRARTAADGAEALQDLRSQPLPDLILLDLTMPVMDGRQFRQEQMRDPVLARIPVVLVSGEPDAAAQATALGIEQLVRKPTEGRVLLDAVHRHCYGPPHGWKG